MIGTGTKIEVAIFPLLVGISLLAPHAVMAIPGFPGAFYLVFVVALAMSVHGMVTLRNEQRRSIFWASALSVIVWFAVSFAPIWFGHATPFVPGSSDYHRHTFWSFAHVH